MEKQETADKILARRKLMLIFGTLLIMSIAVQGGLAVKAAKRAIIEQAETYLVDKAETVAGMLDTETAAFFQYIEALARAPIFTDPAVSNSQKAKALYAQGAFNDTIRKTAFCEMNGLCFTSADEVLSAAAEEWFTAAVHGKQFVSEPSVFQATNEPSFIFAVPVYADNKITGVVSVFVTSDFFSEKIRDITVGHTGHCFAVGLTGATVAHRASLLVKKMTNIVSEAAEDIGLSSFRAFMETALAGQTGIGYYTFLELPSIAAYAAMETTGWTVILTAPEQELIGRAKTFTTMSGIIAVLLVITALPVACIAAMKVGNRQK